MFDPEKVDFYEYTYDCSDRSGDMYSQTAVRSVVDGDEFVFRNVYNQLLKLHRELLDKYNELDKASSQCLPVHKDWPLAERPEIRQRCTNHKWLDTNQQLPRWPPVKVYKCGLCGLTGKLPSRLTPKGFPQYDLSDMTYEGCPENGQTK